MKSNTYSKVAMLFLFSFLSLGLEASTCKEVFSRPPPKTSQWIAKEPSPPKLTTHPELQESIQALRQLQGQGSEASWHQMAKALDQIAQNYSSLRSRAGSAFFGRELSPELSSILNVWSQWQTAKYTVLSNPYREMNPFHENYTKSRMDETETPEQRESARVFPSEMPVVARVLPSSEQADVARVNILHNPTGLSQKQLQDILSSQIPAEIPDGLVVVFRGKSLLENSQRSHSFVVFSPQEHQTFRPLSDEEVVRMVTTPTIGSAYAALPRGASIVQKPRSVPPGARVEYGVRLSFTSARYRNRNLFPFISYVVVKDGQLLEVGVGSREMEASIKEHLSVGRKISETELDEISEMTTAIFKAVSETNSSREAMLNFRGWPAELASLSGVVRFNPAEFDILKWTQDYAAQRGWSEAKLERILVDSGWAEYSFNRFGRSALRILNEEGDLIPFPKDKQGRFTYFRFRRTNPKAGVSKYREFPESYSVVNNPREEHVPYTPEIHKRRTAAPEGWRRLWSGLVNSLQTKTLVVTEGEFKALVAEYFGPYQVVSLSGIHSYSQRSLKWLSDKLKDEKFSEVVIIFDGDPAGKGLARADGLSDSKRQAFALARELEQFLKGSSVAVKIGLLPKSDAPGAKDAIDDAIMADQTEGLRSYIQAVRTAEAPAAYAERIKLDTTLVELYLIHRGLEQNLVELRSGLSVGAPLSNAEREMIAKGEGMLAFAEKALKDHLRRFYGTESLSTSEKTIARIPPAGNRADYKPRIQLQVSVNGSIQDITQYFRHEVILVPMQPLGTTSVDMQSCLTAACMELPYSLKEIAELVRSGSSSGNKKLDEDYEAGWKIARAQNFAPRSPSDQRLILAAGYLQNRFYPGEIIELGVQLVGASADVKAPLLVVRRKSSGNAIGLFSSEASGAAQWVQEVRAGLRPSN